MKFETRLNIGDAVYYVSGKPNSKKVKTGYGTITTVSCVWVDPITKEGTYEYRIDNKIGVSEKNISTDLNGLLTIVARVFRPIEKKNEKDS